MWDRPHEGDVLPWKWNGQSDDRRHVMLYLVSAQPRVPMAPLRRRNLRRRGSATRMPRFSSSGGSPWSAGHVRAPSNTVAVGDVAVAVGDVAVGDSGYGVMPRSRLKVAMLRRSCMPMAKSVDLVELKFRVAGLSVIGPGVMAERAAPGERSEVISHRGSVGGAGCDGLHHDRGDLVSLDRVERGGRARGCRQAGGEFGCGG